MPCDSNTLQSTDTCLCEIVSDDSSIKMLFCHDYLQSMQVHSVSYKITIFISLDIRGCVKVTCEQEVLHSYYPCLLYLVNICKVCVCYIGGGVVYGNITHVRYQREKLKTTVIA